MIKLLMWWGILICIALPGYIYLIKKAKKHM